MGPKEFRTAIRAMQREIGSRAKIFAGINDRDPGDGAGLDASIYANWPAGDVTLRVQGDDWAALLDALRSGWEAYQVEYTQRLVRKMALEIIRVTAEQGECTDAALRGFDFTAEQVARFGALACADADAIASNGPFAITAAAKANAA